MPIRPGTNGKLALLCTNDHVPQEKTTMLAYGMTKGLGARINFYSCKVCGYIELYDAAIVDGMRE